MKILPCHRKAGGRILQCWQLFNKGHSEIQTNQQTDCTKKKRKESYKSESLWEATWKQQKKTQTQKTSKSSQTWLQPKASKQEERKQKPHWKFKPCSPSLNTHRCLALTISHKFQIHLWVWVKLPQGDKCRQESTLSICMTRRTVSGNHFKRKSVF